RDLQAPFAGQKSPSMGQSATSATIASVGIERADNQESLPPPGPIPKPKTPAPKAPTAPDKKSEARQPTLRLGDQSVDGWVEYLQKLLNAILDPSPNLKLNGNFDQATYKAVVAYQKREGLVVDGVVGNQTWASLRFANPEMA